jgi:hypothetical protein
VVGEVRPVKARHHHLGLAHPQTTQDVLADAGRGGSREREDRRAPEISHCAGQKEVVGAEIVAPLAYAVGLVHHEEAHARPA